MKPVGSGLHDCADPGSPLFHLQARLVPDQNRLVPEAAVPGRLAAAQVGGGGGELHVLLLLLPDQQGRVPVPQPGEVLRQSLLCQGGADRTWSGGALCSWVTVRHVDTGMGTEVV